MEIEIKTDDYVLTFSVAFIKDYIDTDRGVKTEVYAEVLDLVVRSIDTGEILNLSKEETNKLYDQYGERAEIKAMEHYS